jgi:multicomponent Na+:H+ antiporter subunit D
MIPALPILVPAVLLVAAVIAVPVGIWRPGAATATAFVGTLAGLALSVVGLVEVWGGGAVRHELSGWPPPIGIEYVLDPLSALFAVIITFIGLVVVVYPAHAGFYSAPDRHIPLAGLVLLLLAGLLGVVMSGDLFNLFVFLEIYAIATYALITLGGDRAVFAGFRYLIFGTIGSGFYLLGVGFLYFSTGSLNMADVAARIADLGGSPTIVGATVLIVIGLGLKMALFPLHVWLPDAHSTAPPAVAALLAAVQVKVGAYALLRILFDVIPPDLLGRVPVGTALAWFGGAGILVGSVLAVMQTDFKRLLAWSTVAQLGFIGLGIGLANPLALVGAMLHVLHHAFMKSGLFLVAGAVVAQTGRSAIAGFTGLGRAMPLTMVGFVLAALSMVGIPPTAGFFSKWYLLPGSLDAGSWALAVIIVASSLLTAVYFLRVFERVYADPDDAGAGGLEAAGERGPDTREPGVRLVGPILVLGVGVVVLGLVNALVVGGLLDPVVTEFDLTA